MGGCIPHNFWNKLDDIHRKRFDPITYINVFFCKIKTMVAWEKKDMDL
jgi:hypothetical protein